MYMCMIARLLKYNWDAAVAAASLEAQERSKDNSSLLTGYTVLFQAIFCAHICMIYLLKSDSGCSHNSYSKVNP